MKKTLGPDPRFDVKTPSCPLCHDEMKRELRVKRGIYVFACAGVEAAVKHKPIVCAVDDPFVGRWEEAQHKATEGQGTPCPMSESSRACKGKMRYFATRTGFMLAVCPEPTCGAQMSNGGSRKEGTVENVSPDAPGIVQ